MSDFKISNISDEEYFGDYGVKMSKSLLGRFVENPAGFGDYLKNRKNNDQLSDALVFGRLVHMLTLEGMDEVNKHFTVMTGDCNPKTGKPYGRRTQKWLGLCEARGVNKWSAITPNEFDLAHDMCNAVWCSTRGRDAVTNCTMIEFAITGTLMDVDFQCKVDAMNDRGYIMDLKTIRPDADPVKSGVQFKYHWQAWIYREMYFKATGTRPQFDFVFVTKEKQPTVTVLDAETYFDLDKAGEEVRVALNAFRKAREAGDWRVALFYLGGL